MNKLKKGFIFDPVGLIQFIAQGDKFILLISETKAIVLTTAGEKGNIEYESEILVEFYRRASKSLNVDIEERMFISR